MHLLIVPSEYPSKDHKLGGIFIKEQRNILKNKIKVGIIHIYLFSIFNLMKIKFLEFKNISKKEKFYRISFLRLPKLKLLNYYIHYFFFNLLFKKYIRNHGRPDIIHAHFSEFTVYTLLKIKKKYKIPYVITEHSTDFLDGRFLSQYNQNSFSFKIVKKGFEEAKYVLCVSSVLKIKLKRIFNLRNLYVVHNFTKIKKTQYNKIYDFIFVGDLIVRKNPLLLLKAYKEYFKSSKKKLVIIGNGKLLNKLKNYIFFHNLKNVILLNNIKRNEVLKKISQSKIIISTSRYETFGISLIEGLSYGLKILSTDSGGPRDIVTKSNGLLLKRKDSTYKKLGYSMKKLSGLKINKKKIIAQYRKKFSEDVILEKLITIYKKSLKN